MPASPSIQLRTRATLWFGVVVFGYYYKAVLCGLLGHTLGVDAICSTWVRGISSNHWIEIAVYCPALWFALHQVNTDVFGDIPARPDQLADHRRRHLVGEFAIALVFYGTGIHVANVVEIYSRERQSTAVGEVYDLVYFLDEGLSHYLQFVPLFFVIGWFVMNDRLGRTAAPMVAVFFGVAHGVERAIGIIEGGKWFLGPPTVAWLGLAAWLRWRRVGPQATREFFFRYACAFCLSLPVSQAVYYLRFRSFDQPSALPTDELAQVAVGGIVVTLGGSLVLAALDRVWRTRRLPPAF